MKNPTNDKRIIRPTLLVLLAAAVSYAGYFGLRQTTSSVHQLTATFFGTTLFLSVAFGPFYVTIVTHLRGVTLSRRILAASITPFIWMTKEVLRLTESHPLPECLYWYLNPLNIWLICLMIMEIGVATLIARAIQKRRGQIVHASPLVPALVSLTSLVLVISLYAWGKGENVYVLFLEGYRLFFGTGV